MSTKYSLIKQYLMLFLENEVKKVGLNNVVIGLSGGIDSAVVAVLLQEVFQDDCLAVMLPTKHSSQSSIDDAKELCMLFDIKYKIQNIDTFVQVYIDSFEDNQSNKDIGNFCARMRMSMLYDISSKQKALVIGTSNKSELLLGYGTIFGDLSSAINPIGDLYKSEIFEFASYLGINRTILDKKPSADLFEGQSDESDIGYSYEQIDSLLVDMIDKRVPKEQLKIKFDNDMIDSLHKRISVNHFKRHMPIIAKISNRTIGHDFLYPRDMGL
jgi:NAD+ synthase